MITNTPIRFFTSCLIIDLDSDHEVDLVEITESQFQALQGVIIYERNTMFTNGVNQVILTVECLDVPLYEELDIIK